MEKNQRNATFMAAWKETVVAIEFSEKYKADYHTAGPSDNSDKSSLIEEKINCLANGNMSFEVKTSRTDSASLNRRTESSNSIGKIPSVAKTKIYLGDGNTHTIQLDVKEGRNKIAVISAKRRIADAANSEDFVTQVDDVNKN